MIFKEVTNSKILSGLALFGHMMVGADEAANLEGSTPLLVLMGVSLGVLIEGWFCIIFLIFSV